MAAFFSPIRIEAGPGCFDRIASAVGDGCYLITSAGTAARGVVERFARLAGARLEGVYAKVDPNPTVQSVMEAAREIGSIRARRIVAIGGGSVLDTAKAVAAQMAVPDDPQWLAKHLRHGASFPERFEPVPLVMAPTTSGTGSEVTMWGTIWDEVSHAKYSISHPALYPAFSFVDSELTRSAPADLTVTTALDALSHAMEAVWSRNWNPVSDALAAGAITILPQALLETDRDHLARASLLAGMAMSNTRTALAHSISYPLTGELGLPHGLACSLTLPEILRLNGAHSPGRVLPILKSLGASSVADAADQISHLFEKAGVGPLLQRHLTRDRVNALCTTFITAGRADNNIAPVNQEIAKAILEQSLDRFGIT